MQAQDRGLGAHGVRRRNRGSRFLQTVGYRVGRNPVVAEPAMGCCDRRNGTGVPEKWLNSTSPPPLTWMSTNPGASQTPSGSTVTAAISATSASERFARSSIQRQRPPRGRAGSRHRTRSLPQRRDGRIRSSGPRHLLQVTRTIDIAAAALCDLKEQLIEGLYQANCVGIRMVRVQRRQKSWIAFSSSCRKHRSALAHQIGSQIFDAWDGLIGWREQQNRIGRLDQRNRAVLEFCAAECFSVEIAGLLISKRPHVQSRE